MENILVILEVLGIYVVLPVIIGLIIIGSFKLYRSFVPEVSGSSYEKLENLVCTIDTDCPAGYVCIDGHCIPHRDAESIVSAAI